MVGAVGLEDGVQQEGEFRRDGPAGGHGGGRFQPRTGEHVVEEAAGFVDGAGFDELGIRADGAGAGEPEVADFDSQVVRMGAGQGESGMEDFHAGEELGMAGESGEAFHQLADDEQGQPGGQRVAAGEP